MTNITFGNLPGDRISLTSLMDEQYAIDISKKIQFILNDYIKEGKYVTLRDPYGYRKSDSDCHTLVPDMESAVVRCSARKGSGNAGWYFFTCISNNRLGAGHCTGIYIRESEIMDAIIGEVKNFVRANETTASKYKSETAGLVLQAKQLEHNINEQLEMSRVRYEDFVMSIANKDDLTHDRQEREILQIEL